MLEGVISLALKMKGHKPRNAGVPRMWEKQAMGSPLEPPEETQPC